MSEHEKFVEAVQEAMVNELTISEDAAARILAVPGAWELFSEHYNNEAIEIMEDEDDK